MSYENSWKTLKCCETFCSCKRCIMIVVKENVEAKETAKGLKSL